MRIPLRVRQNHPKSIQGRVSGLVGQIGTGGKMRQWQSHGPRCKSPVGNNDVAEHEDESEAKRRPRCLTGQ